MAFDEELAQRIREILIEKPGCSEKKMFGGIGLMLKRNMACGVIDENLIIRVGMEAYPEALQKPYVETFDMTGRPMTGWVIVTEDGYRKDSKLLEWVEQGAAYAASLPEK